MPNFSFTQDPEWAGLPEDEKQAIVKMAFDDQISSDPEFSALEQTEQAQIFELFSQDVIAGGAASSPFEKSDTEDPVFLTHAKDVGLSYMAGAAEIPGALSQAAKFLGLDKAHKYLQGVKGETKEYWVKGMSESGKKARKSPFLSPNEGQIFGETPIKTLLMAAAGSGAVTVATGAVGAPLVKGLQAARAGGRVALALQKTGISGRLARKVGHLTPTGAGYGSAEGLISGLSNANQSGLELEKKSHEDLLKSPVYNQLLADFNGDQDKAKKELRDEVEMQTFLKTGTATSVFGALFSGGIVGQIARGPQGGVLKSGAKGVLAEGKQELFQSGAEEYASNTVTRDLVDPSKDVWEGVTNAAVTGMGAGMIMGGAMGGAQGLQYDPLQKQKIDEDMQQALGAINPGVADLTQVDTQTLAALRADQDFLGQAGVDTAQVDQELMTRPEFQQPTVEKPIDQMAPDEVEQEIEQELENLTRVTAPVGVRAGQTTGPVAQVEQGIIESMQAMQAQDFGRGVQAEVEQDAMTSNLESLRAGTVAQPSTAQQSAEAFKAAGTTAAEVKQDVHEGVQADLEEAFADPETAIPVELRPAVAAMEADLEVGAVGGVAFDEQAGTSKRYPSTNPDWFKNKEVKKFDQANGTNYAGKVNKLSVARTMKLVRANKELTDNQEMVWDYIQLQAKEVAAADPSLNVAEMDKAAVIEEQAQELSTDLQVAQYEEAQQAEERGKREHKQEPIRLEKGEKTAGEVKKIVAGKTDKPSGVDPADFIQDGTVYTIEDRKLTDFAEQEDSTGVAYDSTVDMARATEYAKHPITTPIIAAMGRDSDGKLYIQDGGHRFTAARIRGDKTIKTIVPKQTKTTPKTAVKPEKAEKVEAEVAETAPSVAEKNKQPPARFTVKVGPLKVEVVKNPTDADIQANAMRFKEEFPNAPAGEVKTRSTIDEQGNEYSWYAGDSAHNNIEDYLKAEYGLDANQNNTSKGEQARQDEAKARWAKEAEAEVVSITSDDTEAGIYKTSLNEKDYFAVKTVENMRTGKTMGDTLHGTLEEARKEVALTKVREDEKKDRLAELDKDIAIEAKEKAILANIDGFAADKTPLQLGRITKTLNRDVSIQGNLGKRKDLIKGLVSKGYRVVTETRQKFVKDESGEKVLKDVETGKKILSHPSDGGFFDVGQLTVVGMEYAEFLQAKPITPKKKDSSRTGLSQEQKKQHDELESLLEWRVKNPTNTAKAIRLARAKFKKSPAEIDATISFLKTKIKEAAITHKKHTKAERVEEKPKAVRGDAPKTEADIKDFGEKIGGARKDYAAMMQNAVTLDTASVPFAKAWPEPDYNKLLESVLTPEVVGLVRALRDEVPTKPRAKWKIKKYTKDVEELRGFANDLIAGVINSSEFYEEANKNDSISGVSGRAQLYADLGHEISLKGITFTGRLYAMYKGEKDVVKWTIEAKAKKTALSNWPTEFAVSDTERETLEIFRKVHKKMVEDKSTAKPKRKTKFKIYSYRGQKGIWWIGKKMGRDHLDLKRFDSSKEAREYLAGNQEALEDMLVEAKKIPPSRRAENRDRVGEDYRQGKDVTEKMFKEAFGFRGVEFGEWVNAKGERQAALNRAFDALQDLANKLNIPTQALSLNRELGLAFGSRGRGGENAAAAHYEPGFVVINLTRKEGAGSLAHEWWHSLDNYFSRMRKKPSEYLSERPFELMPENRQVRKEMIAAFKGITKAIKATELEERAKELDKRRTKTYWANGAELSARSFESYLVNELSGLDQSSDYLVNISSEGSFDKGEYPYLTESEIPGVKKAFDNFFDVIKTKETDKGVALYSKAQPSTPLQNPSTKKSITADIVAKIGMKSTAALLDSGRVNIVGGKRIAQIVEMVDKGQVKYSKDGHIQGLTMPDGTVYLNQDGIEKGKAWPILLHEVGIHAGLKGLLGKQYDKLLANFRLMRKMGNKKVLAAYARVPEDTPKQFKTEEGLAYYLEANPDTTFAQKVIAAIRQFARKLGLGLRFSESDVIALANAAVTREAKSAVKEMKQAAVGGDAAALRYSKAAKAQPAPYTAEEAEKLSTEQIAANAKYVESMMKKMKVKPGKVSESKKKKILTQIISEKDYALNRQTQGSFKATVVRGMKKVAKDIAAGTDKFLGSISTRLGNINLKLKSAIRQLDYNIGTKSAKDVLAVNRMLEKAKKVMSTDDFKDWDYARKNSDKVKIDKLVKKYNLSTEYKLYRDKLLQFHAEAKDVGLDIGWIDEYAPRILKDPKGFLNAIGKGDDWPVISRALMQKALDRGETLDSMTDEMKADLVAGMLFGGHYGMSGPPNSRERAVEKIAPELNQYYMNSDSALMSYIHSMRKSIEQRKFFGKVPDKIAEAKRRLHTAKTRISLEKAKKSPDTEKISEIEDLAKEYRAIIDKYRFSHRDYKENIGQYVLDLVIKGEVSPEQEKALVDIMTARFHERGTRGVIQGYKNFSYIDTMGSPISALTQIGDLAWAAYDSGLGRTLKNAAKATVGKSRITKEDVGIERIAQEFADSDTLTGAVNKIFKLVGLEKMDTIGKESLLNSALERYEKQAKKNPANLKNEIRYIFGDETDSVISNLQKKKITDNVKLLVYSRLLDFQPAALSEMPEQYLKAGNGRLFYMLKSYTLKQFDVYRREVYQGLKSGDPKTVLKSVRNMVKLSMFLVLANAGADELKDFVLDRKTTLEDRTVDNVLRLFGISKFVTWKARTEGIGSALVKQILPPFKFIDSVTRDIVTAGDEKGLYTTKSVPLVGKLAYWHIGRGSEQADRK